jgi:hypothetical protein
MFCPQCGSNQSDELKFCKSCGSNLQAVRHFLITGEAGGKIDWTKPWAGEPILSESEQARQAELERLRGMTPEVRRYNEIKGGIITGSVGISLMILLFVLMQGIILSGKVPHDVSEILSRIWIAGVIPFFVGVALIINGTFVSRRMIKAIQEKRESDLGIGRDAQRPELRSADTTEFASSKFSVTEGTTKHLSGSGRQ